MQTNKKALLTTSRNPTSRMRTFCHDLARVVPNTVCANRGKMSSDDVAEKALGNGASRVVVVDRWHGDLGVLRLFQISDSGLTQIPPTTYVRGKLHRELGVSGAKLASSISVAESGRCDELSRLARVLSDFFDLPISAEDEADRAGSTTMSISLDKSGKIALTFMSTPRHVEVGPRIIVSRLEW